MLRCTLAVLVRFLAVVSWMVFLPAQLCLADIYASQFEGENGFRIGGTDNYEVEQNGLHSVGDVNGDGHKDFAFSAINSDNFTDLRPSKVYVVFGVDGQFPPSVDVSSLDGSNGFRIVSNVVEDYLGTNVSAIGDFDGDSFDDFVVASGGYSYVILGRSSFNDELNLQFLDTAKAFRISPSFAASGVGDFNGDGLKDLIVGSPIQSGGAAFVLFGRSTLLGQDVNLQLIPSSYALKIEGGFQFENIGQRVDRAGDVNGDGLADVLVRGSPSSTAAEEKAYIIFGHADFGTVNVTALDGSNGYYLKSANTTLEKFVVHPMGDLDNDGFSDLGISMPLSSLGGHEFEGSSVILF